MSHETAQPLGEITRDGGRLALRYERRLAHPPEKVWRALTESEHLRHWFPADIEGERTPGARLVFRFWPDTLEKAAESGIPTDEPGFSPDDPTLPGELRVWEPPRVLEYTWDTDLLRFELAPDGTGTILVFTTWIDSDTQAPHGVEGAAAGYHACLDALGEVLDTGAASLPAPSEVTALEERYAAALAAR